MTFVPLHNWTPKLKASELLCAFSDDGMTLIQVQEIVWLFVVPVFREKLARFPGKSGKTIFHTCISRNSHDRIALHGITPGNVNNPQKKIAIHTRKQYRCFGKIPLLGPLQQQREGAEKGFVLSLKSFMSERCNMGYHNTPSQGLANEGKDGYRRENY